MRASDEPTQSVVAKTAALLRALGVTREGATTTALARQTGLARPTAHRLLVELTSHGMVDRDEGKGEWLLGPELYLLGAVAATRYDVTAKARDVLEDLAEATAESAYLSIRRGGETICLAEVEGSFPLRSHVLHEGLRLPLGVASAGLAILSHLPSAEADAYLGAVDLTPDWGRSHSRRAIRARMATTRERGYSVNPGLLVAGSWGMAAAVFDRAGRARWALSLTGVESRFSERRIRTMGRLLLERAHILGRRIG